MSTPCANCGGDIHFCKDCDFYKGEYIEKSVLADIKAEIADIYVGYRHGYEIRNDALEIIDKHIGKEKE